MTSAPALEAPAEHEAAASRRRARRTLAALLLIAALGALGIVGLGASAERGPLVEVGEVRETEPPRVEQTAEEYSEPDWSVYTVPPRESGGEAPRIITTALVAILAVAAAALLVWLMVRMRALARPPLEEAEEAADVDLTAEQARTALADARTRLTTDMDAQDAVVAAWLALEAAIARAGIRRDPAQTTLEFVVAVLGALDVDRSALDRLAHLYRRALFDDAPLTEADREDALARLDLLAEQLKEESR